MNLPVIENLEASFVQDGCSIKVLASTTRENFISLLEWLPATHKLCFYDQYYPSMSDPGAYVSVSRKDDLFAYKLGNHGWSGDWTKQSMELLASWLFLNLERKNDHSENLSMIDIKKLRKSPWDR